MHGMQNLKDAELARKKQYITMEVPIVARMNKILLFSISCLLLSRDSSIVISISQLNFCCFLQSILRRPFLYRLEMSKEVSIAYSV